MQERYFKIKIIIIIIIASWVKFSCSDIVDNQYSTLVQEWMFCLCVWSSTVLVTFVDAACGGKVNNCGRRDIHTTLCISFSLFQVVEHVFLPVFYKKKTKIKKNRIATPHTLRPVICPALSPVPQWWLAEQTVLTFLFYTCRMLIRKLKVCVFVFVCVVHYSTN